MILHHRGILLSLLITISLQSWTQAVRVGDQLSQGQIEKQIAKVTGLQSFAGKAILLDFWTTYCRNCLEAFPKMDSIQKHYGDQLQVVLVSPQSKETIEKFFAARKKIRKPDLPMVTGDTVLSKLFPYQAVPHYVWIERSRKVAGITGIQEITKKNLDDFVKGKPIALHLKDDFDTAFKKDKPLIGQVENPYLSGLGYYSYISGYVEGVPTMIRTMPNGVQFTRLNLLEMLRKAYSEGGKYDFDHSNSIILNVKDSVKYTLPTREKYFDWVKRYTYSYELLLPPGKEHRLYAVMQEDLSRYFDVKARIEKREINCLVLVRKGKLEILPSKGGPARRSSQQTSETINKINFQHYTPSELTRHLKLSFYASIRKIPTPFVDGTGISYPVDLTLVYENGDLESLKKALNLQGLDLVVKPWKTNVLVIEEN